MYEYPSILFYVTIILPFVLLIAATIFALYFRSKFLIFTNPKIVIAVIIAEVLGAGLMFWLQVYIAGFAGLTFAIIITFAHLLSPSGVFRKPKKNRK
jgi:hypothetical protein